MLEKYSNMNSILLITVLLMAVAFIFVMIGNLVASKIQKLIKISDSIMKKKKKIIKKISESGN